MHRLAMKVDVEALDLFLGRDAQPDDHVDDLEDDEGRDRTPGDADQGAPELGQDLTAIAVDQALLAHAADCLDGEHAGQDRTDEAADAMHAERVERVVVAQGVLQAGGAQKQITPAIRPIARAPVGLTKPEAGVMATRPATAPETMPRTDGLPRAIHSANIQASAAAAAAIWVTAIAMPALALAPTAEPALKPNQPTHSSEAPITE